MTDWINYHCKFCNVQLESQSLLPPNCECDGFVEAKAAWLEEYRKSEEYRKPLTPEEMDKEHPLTYFGEVTVEAYDSFHTLKLEARKYEGGEALTVSIPISEEEDRGSYGWDFLDTDAIALRDLLNEYLEKDDG